MGGSEVGWKEETCFIISAQLATSGAPGEGQGEVGCIAVLSVLLKVIV